MASGNGPKKELTADVMTSMLTNIVTTRHGLKSLAPRVPAYVMNNPDPAMLDECRAQGIAMALGLVRGLYPAGISPLFLLLLAADGRADALTESALAHAAPTLYRHLRTLWTRYDLLASNPLPVHHEDFEAINAAREDFCEVTGAYVRSIPLYSN